MEGIGTFGLRGLILGNGGGLLCRVMLWDVGGL